MVRDQGIGVPSAKRSWIVRALPTSIVAVCLVLVSGFVAPVLFDSATAQSPAMVPERYSSVADLRAQHPFYVAHRGGSSNWPEFSMSAYANSAEWGMGALELSVSRTADGTFFGLHDASLNRTSQVTGDNNPTTMTWEQLSSTYRNKLNAPDPEGVEYARAADVFERFARDHVIFVDTKYVGNTQQRIDLINLMLSYAPADHWVLKGYYDDAALTQLARQYGIQTWGYYYVRDLDEFEQTYAKWDMLGLELSASAAQWQQVKAKGKPVVAFFVDNQADLAEATGKGADGVMVSGVPATLGSPRLEPQEAEPAPTLLAGPNPPALLAGPNPPALLAEPVKLRSTVAVNAKRVVKKRKVVKRSIRATITVPARIVSSPAIRLQQKVRGKWKTVRSGRYTFANTNRLATKFNAKKKVAYRVCAVTNNEIIGTCSKAVKVR